MPRLGEFQEQGLLLQMFELGELLVKKKAVRFYSRGLCMFPCIRPGDTLHVEPRSVEHVNVGDVAVFRRQGSLFAHRVTRVGKKEGAFFIVTRPDTATKDNRPTPGVDVLGIVATVERGGRMFDTEPRCYAGVTDAWLRLQHRVYKLRAQVRTLLVAMIRSCYEKSWYRLLASMLFFHVPVSFTLVAPFGREGDETLFRKITVDDLETGISCWRLMIKAGGRSAGYVSFKPVSNKSLSDDQIQPSLRAAKTAPGFHQPLYWNPVLHSPLSKKQQKASAKQSVLKREIAAPHKAGLAMAARGFDIRLGSKWDVDEVCLRLCYRSTSIERRMWQEVIRIRKSVTPKEA